MPLTRANTVIPALNNLRLPWHKPHANPSTAAALFVADALLPTVPDPVPPRCLAVRTAPSSQMDYVARTTSHNVQPRNVMLHAHMQERRNGNVKNLSQLQSVWNISLWIVSHCTNVPAPLPSWHGTGLLTISMAVQSSPIDAAFFRLISRKALKHVQLEVHSSWFVCSGFNNQDCSHDLNACRRHGGAATIRQAAD